MKIMRFINKKKLVVFSLPIILLFIAIVFLVERVNAPENQAETSKSQSSQPGFDKSKYSLEDSDSPWVVVNKKRPLPAEYAPTDLDGGIRREAAVKLNELYSEAQAQGHNLYSISGFRSYESQKLTYNSFVSRDGQANADTYSARPGHSEHQTGWAIDVGNGTCDLEECFGDTPAGKWIAKNAHEHGFIIRYLEGKNHITGYNYEPWHLRYVGKELANEVYKSNQTLEEFFGLPPAQNY
jgi:zinc D-Ala-D-Ala carboxypeptidase